MSPAGLSLYDGPSPLLVELFHFQWGGQDLRLANFLGDGSQNHWDYDGEQWLKFPVSVSGFRDSPSEYPEVTVSFTDSNRTILSFVEENDPFGATCTIKVVDQIGDVLLETREILVKNWIISEPNKVDVILGSPDLASLYIPKSRATREFCIQQYGLRGLPENMPGCIYPGDEFSEGTKQRFFTPGSGPTVRVEKKFGWFVTGGAGSDTFADSGVNSPDSIPSLNMSRGGFELQSRMRNTNLNGLQITKVIGNSGFDEDTLVDVEAKVELHPINTTYTDPMFGVFVQNANDNGDWLFVGFGGGTSGTTMYRVTDNLVSTTQTFTNSGYTAFRIKRVSATSWEFYARTEALDTPVDGSDDWTLVGTATTGNWSIVRCGVVIAADDDPLGGTSKRVEGWCHHVWFRRGGILSCSRTLNGTGGCADHKFTPSFTGFRTSPRATRI